ncbi:MAG: hypothetical protein RMZ41_030800 [Nostoc sp. DedVER02]|uniref:hypothetical protein n=1 Tax=unclassified Nostoc TaxID=2593658 RepID=UPI002AD4A2A9|nr:MULTISPECIES: hypothetical protein [unclassified Nostoc]MDZ7989168.1 hypothetical protein [Nostoc sp. DedVER02]MDZ8111704.1 hypothetical protein [Nostoc sp. DedVER01b]
MNHFKFKSLAFYAVAIGSVLLLFRTVSVYGENNLKAPLPVNGRYRLTLSENLPNCEKSDTLTLNIQQSGIYLNASVLPANAKADTDDKHSLAGIFKNKQLNLSGKVGRSILCNIPRPQNDPLNSVTIQMQLVDKGNVTGQLSVSGIPQTLKFTAVPEKAEEKSQKL